MSGFMATMEGGHERNVRAYAHDGQKGYVRQQLLLDSQTSLIGILTGVPVVWQPDSKN
jgi:hypothetical protein